MVLAARFRPILLLHCFAPAHYDSTNSLEDFQVFRRRHQASKREVRVELRDNWSLDAASSSSLVQL